MKDKREYNIAYRNTLEKKQSQELINNAVKTKEHFEELKEMVQEKEIQNKDITTLFNIFIDLLENFINSFYEDKEAIPRLHKEAAKAKNAKALFYLELKEKGLDYLSIAKIEYSFIIFDSFHYDEIQIDHRQYKENGEKINGDKVRHYLNRTIYSFLNDEIEPIDYSTMNIQRLDQYVYLKGLIDLYKNDPTKEKEVNEYKQELEVITSFIDNIEYAYVKEIFENRFYKRIEWDRIGYSNPRDIVKTELAKYNKINN